jgi:hypothetical protein
MKVMRRSVRRRLPSKQELTGAECPALVRALFRRWSTTSCLVVMLVWLFGQEFRTCRVVSSERLHLRQILSLGWYPGAS